MKNIQSFDLFEAIVSKSMPEPANYIDISHPSLKDSYKKEEKKFTFDISELDKRNTKGKWFTHRGLVLYNKDTKQGITMNQVKVDKDGSGEDIYGWRFEGEGYKLLIVND